MTLYSTVSPTSGTYLSRWYRRRRWPTDRHPSWLLLRWWTLDERWRNRRYLHSARPCPRHGDTGHAYTCTGKSPKQRAARKYFWEDSEGLKTSKDCVNCNVCASINRVESCASIVRVVTPDWWTATLTTMCVLHSYMDGRKVSLAPRLKHETCGAAKLEKISENYRRHG